MTKLEQGEVKSNTQGYVAGKWKSDYETATWLHSLHPDLYANDSASLDPISNTMLRKKNMKG